ncbi:MAG: flagellar hook protein FlgE [Desulfobacca sp.]|nr:flagellar hook protein FlgE [Desulfobacca sp.]
MSIASAMFSGVSGLTSHGLAMGVIGDNVANINTTGFKYSRANFQDLLSQTLTLSSGINQMGKGTQISQIDTIFSQGSLQSSGDATDVGINGNGFFILKNPDSGGLFYSRDGNFYVDKDGYMVNSTGYRVQGKAIDPNTGAASGTDTNIIINQNYSAPMPTSEVDLLVNLNSQSSIDDTYSTSIAAYDSTGNSHNLTLTFTKTADLTWEVNITVDGADPGVTANEITFDSSGNLTGGGSWDWDLSAYNIGASGGTGDTAFSLGSSTQYAAASVTNSASQDGYGPGYFERLTVNQDGIITASYSNGKNKSLYQLDLARFNAPQKLIREGNNLLIETTESGTPITGVPNSNGMGSVQGNALEQSNVDLADEFVKMILYQRGYQANSRIITTSDTLLEETLALKR